jgi:DNA-binding response OmpR family regulator
MKVLIADDDKLLTELLATGLRAKGCEVVTAVDAMQAFMAAMRARPHVIVLDINMPGGTGIEALKKLKASTKTAGIPVLVLSASTEPEAAEATVRKLGAAAYVKKPVAPEDLYNALVELRTPGGGAAKG